MAEDIESGEALLNDVRKSIAECRGKTAAEIAAHVTGKLKEMSVLRSLLYLSWFVGMVSPTEAVETVQSRAPKQRVCGRRWHARDKAYKCEQCGADPTCAICTDCFDAGDHTGHDYRLISTGGGMCDCGDPSAWKPEGFCRNHSGCGAGDDPLSHFPEEFVESCKGTLRAAVGAVVEASQSTSEGESDVHMLATWLIGETKVLGEGFVRLLTEALLDDSAQPCGHCALWLLVKGDAGIAKQLRKSLHELYYVLIGDVVFKSAFASVLLAHYQSLMAKFCEPTETKGERDDAESVLQFSVQLFTVKGIVERLISESGLFDVLLGSIQGALSPAQSEGVFDVMSHVLVSLAYTRAVYDLRGVLQLPECAAMFLADTRNTARLMDLLAPLQGSNLTVRKTGDHVEYEGGAGEKTTTFEIQTMPASMLLVDALKRMASTAGGAEMLGKVASSAIASLLRITRRYGSADSKFEFHDRCGVRVVKHDISAQGASFHCPLNRITAMFTREALAAGLQLSDVTSDVPWNELGPRLLEAPLRVQALAAQVDAGLWVRNGNEVRLNSSWYQRSTVSRDVSFDPDFLAIQLAAAMMPADAFSTTVLDRFGCLGGIAASQVVERALALLISVATDRSLLPETSDRALARRELIHMLCASDMAFSELTKEAIRHLDKQPWFEEVLGEVATFSRATANEGGTYKLKEECWGELDPYYLHWTQRELSAVEEHWATRAKKRGAASTMPCPAPAPAPAEPFRALPRILGAASLHLVVARALRGEFSPDLPGDEIGERLLTRCLHVLEICLRDEADGDVAGTAAREALRGEPGESTVTRLCRMHKHPRHAASVCRVLHLLAKREPACADLISDSTGNPSIVSGGADGASVDGKSERERALQRARERQAAIMKQFKEQQQAFLGSQTTPELDVLKSPTSARNQPCVLCRSQSTEELAFLGYVQRTDLLARARERCAVASWAHGREDPQTMMNPLAIFLRRGTAVSPAVVQCCFHGMHLSCWEGFMKTLKERRDRGEPFDGVRVANLDRGQFVCPACRRVCNVLIPTTGSAEGLTEGVIAQIIAVANRYQETPETLLTSPVLEIARSFAATVEGYEMNSRRAPEALAQAVGEVKSDEVGNILRMASRVLRSKAGDVGYWARAISGLVRDGVSVDSVPLLACDSFSLLVVGALTADDRQDAHGLVQLDRSLCSSLLLCEAAKVFVASFGSGSCSAPAGPSVRFASLAAALRAALGVGEGVPTPSDATVESCCLPFLRQCALLATITSKRPIPTDGLSFGTLVDYLHLGPPPFSEAQVAIAAGWCRALIGDTRAVTVLAAPASPFSLVRLPDNYSEVLQSVRGKACPQCGTVPDEPALCLFCGAVVCAAGTCCRRGGRGECIQHAALCMGAGVFLLVSQAVILFLRSDGHLGTFWQSCYLDAHGEEDPGLLRGKPLFLDKTRLEQLERLVSEHGVDSACSMSRDITRSFVWELF